MEAAAQRQNLDLSLLALLLQNLNSRLPQLAIGIQPKGIIKGFQLWKEITSTSPSSRHLCRYKALLRQDGRINKETTQ
jgi:hypothetical protein